MQPQRCTTRPCRLVEEDDHGSSIGLDAAVRWSMLIANGGGTDCLLFRLPSLLLCNGPPHPEAGRENKNALPCIAHQLQTGESYGPRAQPGKFRCAQRMPRSKRRARRPRPLAGFPHHASFTPEGQGRPPRLPAAVTIRFLYSAVFEYGTQCLSISPWRRYIEQVIKLSPPFDLRIEVQAVYHGRFCPCRVCEGPDLGRLGQCGGSSCG